MRIEDNSCRGLDCFGRLPYSPREGYCDRNDRSVSINGRCFPEQVNSCEVLRNDTCLCN